jgi:hypothetical protein
LRPISKIPTRAAILYVAAAVLVTPYTGLIMPYAGPAQGGVTVLRCNIFGNVSFILGASRDTSCTYEAGDTHRIDAYMGKIKLFIANPDLCGRPTKTNLGTGKSQSLLYPAENAVSCMVPDVLRGRASWWHPACSRIYPAHRSESPAAQSMENPSCYGFDTQPIAHLHVGSDLNLITSPTTAWRADLSPPRADRSRITICQPKA